MKLSQEFLTKQKNRLLEEKKRLEELVHKLKEYPDYGFDSDNNIRESSDFENNMFIKKETEDVLKKVKKALLAIEDGTYGRCPKCKEAIAQGRLEITPYADICVNCSKNKKR